MSISPAQITLHAQAYDLAPGLPPEVQTVLLELAQMKERPGNTCHIGQPVETRRFTFLEVYETRSEHLNTRGLLQFYPGLLSSIRFLKDVPADTIQSINLEIGSKRFLILISPESHQVIGAFQKPKKGELERESTAFGQ
ncbi:MAG: hypothetical protein ACOCZ8_00970 [Bacteroidota bacterium]